MFKTMLESDLIDQVCSYIYYTTTTYYIKQLQK